MLLWSKVIICSKYKTSNLILILRIFLNLRNDYQAVEWFWSRS